MAEQAYAYVTLIPVAKGFQSAVASELKGTGGAGGSAGKAAGSQFKSGFGGALKGIAAIAGTALAAAGVGQFVKSSISQASDLEESINAVNVAFGNSAQGILDFGKTSATELGVAAVDYNNAAVRFSAFADRIVGAGNDSSQFIADVTTRAADFASVFNIDVSEALQVFQSGLAGEAEPLKRFGINLLDSEVSAFAMANGIGEAGRQLTETEKVQARYGLLLESTNKVQGDFANTSDSLANSQRILSSNFKDMQAQVGNALVPAFASLTTALVPVVEQMGPILTQVFEELSPVITDLAEQVPGLLLAFSPLLPVIGNLAGLFLNLAAQVLPLFVEVFNGILPIITKMLPLVIDFLMEAITPLIPAFLNLAQQLFPIVNQILPILFDLLEMVLPIFLDLLTDVVIPLIPTIMQLVEAFLPLLENVLPILFDLLENFVIPVFMTVVDIFKNIMVGAIDILSGAFENFGVFIEGVAETFKNVWTGVQDFFRGFINGTIGMFEAFVNSIIDGTNNLIRALNTIQIDIPATAFSDAFTLGVNLPTIGRVSIPRLAEGGYVDQPTTALIGEAGPEVVIPLDRFERMMGMDEGQGKTVNYYAAPNQSIDSEQALFQAMRRAKVVANW